MSKYINRWCAPLALAVALTAAACSKDKTSDTLAQDSSLNRDLQMANQDSTAQPQLKDVPANSIVAGNPARILRSIAEADAKEYVLDQHK